MTGGAAWLVGASAYLLAHFLIYVLRLRRLPGFTQEATIFRYHAFSAIVLATGLTLAMATSRLEAGVPVAVALISLHGIYSLSFLELWSLSQGSYSLAILESLSRGTAGEAEKAALEEIGAMKGTARLAHLEDLGLIRREAALLQLTLVGYFAATALRAVAWIVESPRR